MKKIYIIFLFLIAYKAHTQETMPVYSDYLTDNYFLIHPSATGIDQMGKIRITSRKQWLDFKNSPSLETFSGFVNLKNKMGIGFTLFNDKNGHFSKFGTEVSYAYHIQFGYRFQQQVSFGLSSSIIKNSLDTSEFEQLDIDTSIYNGWFYNAGLSIGYRNLHFYSFYTLKNLLPKYLNSNKSKKINFKQHFLSLGYVFTRSENKKSIRFNPSFLLQYKEFTNDLMLDSNIKFYFPTKKNEIWSGLSFRNHLIKTNYESPKYLSFFIGGKLKNIVLAYTYTHQINRIVFSTTGFHQITLGYNFKVERKQERFFEL